MAAATRSEEVREKFCQVSCGQVTVRPGSPGYAGATKHTNNTAELTALLRAVEYEAAHDGDGAVEFCVDSTYAIHTATGRWYARKCNKELVRRLRCALDDLVRRRGRANVHVTHVRSHTNLTGNEIADGLAKLAATDATIGDDRAMQLALDEYERLTTTTHQAAAPHQQHVQPVQPHSMGVG